MGLGAWHLLAPKIPRRVEAWVFRGMILILALAVGLLLTDQWLPLGPSAGFAANATVVLAPIAVLLGGFAILTRVYPILLRWFLDHKPAFLFLPLVVVSWGLLVWLGAPRLLGRLPEPVRRTALYRAVYHAFPGLGKEFMPSLDEGSFLYMPTTMPHASIGEALSVLQLQDRAFAAIPEVEEAVGKIGRAETPLDPAPVSMIETVVSYKNEYLLDEDGRRLRFRFDRDAVDLARDEHGVPFPAPDGEPYQVKGAFAYVNGGLVPDPKGTPFRLWRPPLDPNLNPGRQAWAGIRSPDDIWDELIRAGEVPGTTSAPRLQPIAARLVMLQSGMRAPLGIKVKGPDLETIEQVALRLEELLREVPAVEPSTVLADRIVGKPYLEIRIDRQAIARYGLPLRRVQDVIEIAVGGRRIMTTVEGRERYPVRVRYLRELRDSVEALERVLVPASADEQIPLGELAEIRFVRGPQMIKSEDTFLVGYVIFDKRQGVAEVDTVEACRRFLDQCLADGRLQLPAGVSYSFAGSYQNQVRAARTLSIVLPLALILIFLILYFQFHSVATTFMVFSGILVAWGGGFILVWFYGQDWFLDVALFGTNLRDLFQIGTVNLSVAIWVGFLALFGIASDDGVVIASYLDQSFEARTPETVREIREATVAAAMRRIRPCLMTSATTILALMPVLTATGRGSDIMVPMAIPTFGGMLVVLISVFMTPVLYCARAEMRLALARLSR
jgi:Cu(I)/Ag(I) efflux system membrane protein CusA/SilA